MIKILTWLNRPQPLFLFALMVFLYAGTSYADVRDDLADIQKEAHYYYKPDRRSCMAYSYDCPIADQYKVLPKNAVASCTHWAALKASYGNLLTTRQKQINI